MADVELLIKIPEEIYIHLLSRYKYQDTNDIGLSESGKVGVAIKNGTPLPKKHGRLIDANEVIKIANKTKDLHGAIWNATSIIEADKAESEDV